MRRIDSIKRGKIVAILTTITLVLVSVNLGAKEAPNVNIIRYPLEGEWAPIWGWGLDSWHGGKLDDVCKGTCSGYHLGEDVKRNDGAEVYPMADGIVKFAGAVLGYTVIVEHNIYGEYVTTAYYHMKRPEDGGIKLGKEETIYSTKPIGYVSGKWDDHKTTPHLHFAIRKGRYKEGIDPRTGFWYFPGYTTIKCDCNPKNPIHQKILNEWYKPSEFLKKYSIVSPSQPPVLSIPAPKSEHAGSTPAVLCEDRLNCNPNFKTIFDEHPGLDSSGVFEVISIAEVSKTSLADKAVAEVFETLDKITMEPLTGNIIMWWKDGPVISTKNKGAYIFSYKADKISLKEWVDYLASIKRKYGPIGRLTVYAHGNIGRIYLMKPRALCKEDLGSEPIRTQLERLKKENMLNPSAHILLFSCLTGQDEFFIQELANITGAWVHANREVTGRGGRADWELQILKAPQVIIPAKEPVISKSISLGPYPSGAKYYLRVFNTDDLSKVKINGMDVLSVGYYKENEIDITGYLKEGQNSIELALENTGGGWTYGYTLKQRNNLIWNETCGNVGREGCKNNDQTRGIVARHSINLTIAAQAISTPTPSPPVSLAPSVDKPPNVTSFSASASQITQDQSITIHYSVTDDMGLKQVELWRADDSAGVGFREIKRISISGRSYSGSTSDTPSSPGTYRYGLHVVDTSGKWNCERNSQSGSSPGVYGPRQVVVIRTTVATPTPAPAPTPAPTPSDIRPPNVISFSASASQINQGQSIALHYSVTDDFSLKQVELWRADDTAGVGFREIKRASVSGKQYSGSISDTPPSAGTYRYGLHAVDNSGKWNDERNSQTGSSPGVYGPRQVVVMGTKAAPPAPAPAPTPTPTPSDLRPPNVTSFSVSAFQINQGQSVTLSYSVVDDFDLKQIELWRADDSAGVGFREIKRVSFSGKQYSGSISDTPPSPGTYRYGLHVVDTSGKWNCERNSQSGSSPGAYGPKQVVVMGTTAAPPAPAPARPAPAPTPSNIRPPNVTSFSASASQINPGQSVTLSYSVTDDAGLKQVELWRADDTAGVGFREIKRISISGKSYSGSISDSPSLPGTYRYGLHVVDTVGKWNDERNSQTGSSPGVYGPRQVMVIRASTPAPPPAPPASPAPTPQVVSARIDGYSPGDPNNPIRVNVGGSATLSVRFTNTGNTAWRFIVGASVWDSNRRIVGDYSTSLSSPLQPGQQTSVSWNHQVRNAGDYWVQFGIWKATPFVKDNLLDKKPTPAQRLIIGSK